MKPSEGSSLWEEFDESITQLLGKHDPTSTAIVELDKYLSEEKQGSISLVGIAKKYLSWTVRSRNKKAVYSSYFSTLRADIFKSGPNLY